MNPKAILLCAVAILISSCSSTYQSYYQTLKFAFITDDKASIELEQVNNSSVDLMAVTLGERPEIIMALAFLENGQHKWVAQDNSMLTIEQGRIVTTLGLHKNLLYVSAINEDPLKNLPFDANNQALKPRWNRTIDLSGDQYGYPVESSFRFSQSESLHILNQNIKTDLYVEDLTYLAPSNYVTTENTWNNYYWYTKSGDLVKSIQQLTPLSQPITTTYLSRIARLKLNDNE